MSDWQLALTKSIQYVDFMGRRTLAAAVTLPNTCYEARIARSPLDIWPPLFLIQTRKISDSSTFCTMVTGVAWVSLDLPHGPNQILVADAKGQHRMDVQIVKGIPKTQPHRLYSSDSETSKLPQRRSALGYSSNWSLEEAMRDAINSLSSTPTSADELFTYAVDHIGAEIGGIVGFNRLVVQVSEAIIVMNPVKP